MKLPNFFITKFLTNLIIQCYNIIQKGDNLMVKVYDKVVLEKDNEKIEIIKDDFYADNYIGYTIKECKKMIKINNNELEFKSNLERESFLNLLEQSLCVDENNCNIKLYSNWLIKIDFEVIKDFQDGLAIIKENGKYGLIKKNENYSFMYL